MTYPRGIALKDVINHDLCLNNKCECVLIICQFNLQISYCTDMLLCFVNISLIIHHFLTQSQYLNS